MTGILVSLKGGVMNPMWNLWCGSGVCTTEEDAKGKEDEDEGSREASGCGFAVVGEIGDRGAKGEEGWAPGCGDEGFNCSESRRIASWRTSTRRGRSVDDFIQY